MNGAPSAAASVPSCSSSAMSSADEPNATLPIRADGSSPPSGRDSCPTSRCHRSPPCAAACASSSRVTCSRCSSSVSPRSSVDTSHCTARQAASTCWKLRSCSTARIRSVIAASTALSICGSCGLGAGTMCGATACRINASMDVLTSEVVTVRGVAAGLCPAVGWSSRRTRRFLQPQQLIECGDSPAAFRRGLARARRRRRGR